ncbi:MAG: hypothetical protein DMD61_08590 [Gemmatimonadetes bacterium]|nr:MAG: hypothetical protein DMD61_08590 [Gemmatimonadota bacterium]
MRSPPPHSVRAVRAIPRMGRVARATQASANTAIVARASACERIRLYPAHSISTTWRMIRNCLKTWFQ